MNELLSAIIGGVAGALTGFLGGEYSLRRQRNRDLAAAKLQIYSEVAKAYAGLTQHVRGAEGLRFDGWEKLRSVQRLEGIAWYEANAMPTLDAIDTSNALRSIHKAFERTRYKTIENISAFEVEIRTLIEQVDDRALMEKLLQQHNAV